MKLIALIEILSGERFVKGYFDSEKLVRIIKLKTKTRSQKLENVSIALEFLEWNDVSLVNIESADIVDCKLKPILSLIWALKRRYNWQICYA